MASMIRNGILVPRNIATRFLVLLFVLLRWASTVDSFVPLSDASSPDVRQNVVKNVDFVSPLLDYGYAPTVTEFESGSLSEKPLLLYLPGFDGTYMCPFIQFPELGTEFEVWCMTVGMDDRSTFVELKANVLDFIMNMADASPVLDTNRTTSNEDKTTETGGSFLTSFLKGSSKEPKSTSINSKRPLYIAGESFGGILAAEVALSLSKDKTYKKANIDFKGLVLVNPATCYDRSQLAAKGPSVCNLPGPLYPFGLSQLLPLFTDEHSFQQLLLILQAKGLPSVIDDPAKESYMGRVAISLPVRLQYMPQETLQWRLEEWLTVGCARIEPRLSEFRALSSFLRTVIIVGEKDLTLPSIAEAERLLNLLPNCQVHVVEGAGHASTCGSRLDMAAVLRRGFSELQSDGQKKSLKKKGRKKQKEADGERRTAMKESATLGRTGPSFGLEDRYDGASIGLSPLLYWSKENFRRVRRSFETRRPDATTTISDEDTYEGRLFRIATYTRQKNAPKNKQPKKMA